MRELTDKQQKFLDVLFEEAGGNFITAKKMAGYSDNVATSTVTNPSSINTLPKGTGLS